MDSWSSSGEGGRGFPFFGWGMMLAWIIIFFIIGYFAYLDANKRSKNGLLWWILIIIPMIGIIALIIYLILRETGWQKKSPGGKNRDRHSQRTVCEGRDHQRSVPGNEPGTEKNNFLSRKLLFLC